MREVRVLIVDDEGDFALTLAERLRLRGFDAVAVGGADEALAKLDAASALEHHEVDSALEPAGKAAKESGEKLQNRLSQAEGHEVAGQERDHAEASEGNR